MKKFVSRVLVYVMLLSLIPLTTLAATVEVLVEPTLAYDQVYTFSEGLAAAEKDGKWGFIDKMGQEVIPCIYDNVNAFSEDLAAVEKGGMWGFVDKTGQEVIPCIYYNAHSFSEGLAAVTGSIERYPYYDCIVIDKTGQVIFGSESYDILTPFSDGIAIALWFCDGGKCGLISKTGQVVLSPKYNYINYFSDGVASVFNGKYGFIDETGQEIIPCIYDNVQSFSEDLAAVEKGGMWGFVDKTGQEVIPCTYDDLHSFSEDLTAVEKGGMWGFVDKTGQEVIPCIYDNVQPFSEDLAAVEKGGMWGFIDKTGQDVIPCIYDDTRSFSEGLAVVNKDEKWGFIDSAGTVVMPLEYTQVESFSNGLSLVRNGSLWGVLQIAEGTPTEILGITINDATGVSVHLTPPGKEAVLVIALYSDGKMLDMTFKPITSEDMNVTITIPEETSEIKAFVLDGFTTMQPLCETKSLLLPQN